MSRKKKKSAIPEHAQIPVAIVLGVFFAIILAWRFWPKGAVEAVPSPGVAIEAVATSEADLIRLHDLTDSLEAQAAVVVPVYEAPRRLLHNPFLLAVWEPAEEPAPALDAPLFELGTGEIFLPEGPSRGERLMMLELSGTARHGGFTMAMVNGRYLHAGDEIDGFKVKSIHEKYIVLHDKDGESKLQIVSQPQFEAVVIEPPVDGEPGE